MDFSASSVIAVIGMHRSGTSLTMQALGALGAQSGGGLLAGDDFNRNGYWEAGEVVAFHDRILGQLGRHWGTPEHLLPLPNAWWNSSEAQSAQKEARSLLINRIKQVEASKLLALKDPRMTIFLPLWIKAAADLGLPLRAILCLRHPADVAASLKRRDQIDPAMGQALWLSYTLAALEQSTKVPMHISRLDEWYLDPAENLARIAGFAGLSTEGVSPPFTPDLTTKLPETVIEDPLIADWWNELTALQLDETSAQGVADRARLIRQGSGQGNILAAAIRAEVGDTPTHLLTRDLEAYRNGMERVSIERDTYSARAREFQISYSQEAQSRAAAEIRIAEIHMAYQQESEVRESYQEQARRLEEAYKQETDNRLRAEERAIELHSAYTQESSARAEYESAYKRCQAWKDHFDPRIWFRKK